MPLPDPSYLHLPSVATTGGRTVRDMLELGADGTLTMGIRVKGFPVDVETEETSGAAEGCNYGAPDEYDGFGQLCVDDIKVLARAGRAHPHFLWAPSIQKDIMLDPKRSAKGVTPENVIVPREELERFEAEHALRAPRRAPWIWLRNLFGSMRRPQRSGGTSEQVSPKQPPPSSEQAQKGGKTRKFDESLQEVIDHVAHELHNQGEQITLGTFREFFEKKGAHSVGQNPSPWESPVPARDELYIDGTSKKWTLCWTNERGLSDYASDRTVERYLARSKDRLPDVTSA